MSGTQFFILLLCLMFMVGVLVFIYMVTRSYKNDNKRQDS